MTVCVGTFGGRDYILADSDLKVHGSGVELSRFDAGGDGFVIQASLAGTLDLSSMTLTGGASRTDPDGLDGFAAGLFIGTSAADLSDVVISNNVADWGAGLTLPSAPMDGKRPEITITRSRIIGNSAAWGGGAIALTGPGTLTLVDVDLGTGDEENLPDDIAFFDGPPTSEGRELLAQVDFEGRVSVTCTWETRSCE